MNEPLKQFIKETLERGEPCPFKQPPYCGRDYCYLLLDVCGCQGQDEFVAGLLTGRTRFKGCEHGNHSQSWCEYD